MYSSKFPHFSYMPIRPLITTSFNVKPFSTTLWWMSIPSSRVPMVAHVGRMIGKFIECVFTFENEGFKYVKVT